MTKPSADQTRLVVIGAGPGGYAAAFHAADRGMEVTLVDASPKPGGVCLHYGCIPSKALLHVAKVIQEAREAGQWGIQFEEPEVNLDRLRAWKTEVVNTLAGGIEQLCQKRRVRLLQARASFQDSQTLRLQSEGSNVPARLRFDHAIIATGSVPAAPGSLRVDDPRVMDSTSALDLEEVPSRLLVVGGGYIGLEIGCVYAALGAEVTVVELTDSLMPGVDPDLVRPLRRQLQKAFKAIYLSTKVEKLEVRKEGIVAHLEGQGVEPAPMFDRVLVAVGRHPNTQNLGLENTRVQQDERGFVVVDRQGRTDDPCIFAVGDVAGEPMLAHKATRQGKVAIEALAGEPAEFDNRAVPAVVFTDPEIAWCGLTETHALAENRPIRVAKFPWSASGRARTLSRTEGLTKLILEPDTGRVLGMGVVGAGAGELIAEGVLAVEMAATARDLAESIHAHPTLSETIAEAAEAFLGQATHLYQPKG